MIDKQQKHQKKRRKQIGICAIYFSHSHTLTNLSQHHHKYSGTFKYKLRKKKSIFL